MYYPGQYDYYPERGQRRSSKPQYRGRYPLSNQFNTLLGQAGINPEENYLRSYYNLTQMPRGYGYNKSNRPSWQVLMAAKERQNLQGNFYRSSSVGRRVYQPVQPQNIPRAYGYPNSKPRSNKPCGCGSKAGVQLSPRNRRNTQVNYPQYNPVPSYGRPQPNNRYVPPYYSY